MEVSRIIGKWGKKAANTEAMYDFQATKKKT